MRTIGDLWDPLLKSFHSWEDLAASFLLLEDDKANWLLLLSIIPPEWVRTLTLQAGHAQVDEWVGLFSQPNDSSPIMAWINPTIDTNLLVPHSQALLLPPLATRAVVGLSSCQLTILLPFSTPTLYTGYVRRIRILEIKKGQRQTPFFFYAGATKDLQFDPA